MKVKACFPLVVDGNVANGTQDFALLADLDFPVCFPFEVEPADSGTFKSADGRQRSGGNSGIIREFRQRGKRPEINRDEK